MVSLPERKKKTNPKPFGESVSWGEIQQQLLQHKHVYQISAYTSSPKSPHGRGFQRQGDVSPTIKAVR